jgi:hypothetical protein
LFISKKGRNKKWNILIVNSVQGQANTSQNEITCNACGEKGYIEWNCPNKDKLVQRKKSDSNMASGTDTESLLNSIVTINMVSVLARVITGYSTLELHIMSLETDIYLSQQSFNQRLKGRTKSKQRPIVWLMPRAPVLSSSLL